MKTQIKENFRDTPQCKPPSINYTTWGLICMGYTSQPHLLISCFFGKIYLYIFLQFVILFYYKDKETKD